MAKSNTKTAEPALIGGRSIEEWDSAWAFIANGLTARQADLNSHIGLWAAKDKDEFKYIAAVAQSRGGGLSGGLSRAYFQNPSGDGGAGLALVRKHRESWDAYVIKLPYTVENIDITKRLKKAMVARHKPVGNQRQSIVTSNIMTSYANRK